MKDFELAGLPDFVAVGRAAAGEGDYASVSAAEAEILGPRASERRKSDFAAGRVAARRALGKLGMPESDVLQGAGGEPMWPPGVVGSIAHSSGLAMAMLARTGDASAIGLDIEHRRPVQEIAALVAFGEEVEWLGSDPALTEDRLLELFAGKEAIFKAVFPMVRQHFGFEAVRLRRRGAQPGFLATVVAIDLVDVGVPAEIEVSLQWAEDLVIAWVVLASP